MYKYLSIVLIIVTVILAYLWVSKKPDPVDDKPLRDSIALLKARVNQDSLLIDSLSKENIHLDSIKSKIQIIYSEQKAKVSTYSNTQLDSLIRNLW